MKRNPTSRRAFFKGTAAATGGAWLAEAAPATRTMPDSGGSVIVASDSSAIAETTAGKVRGYTRNGIYTFKGIPYGASTAGAARFMPPQKPAPWTGVRSSLYYGPVSPQGPRAGWAIDENAFMFEWDDGQLGEDCLRVNIWSPSLAGGKKRPVMVWLHGGGFSAGSGQELKSYDGENLSRRGDVVVVSLNHRLNALGYLNLAGYGAKYASSANVGQLDLVAALEWVRDNIANFGGDPANVTIFGQSGGGGKVGTLMGMPAAKGLFHRAIIQSGSSLRQMNPEDSARLTSMVLSELGLSASQVDKLQEIPVGRLMEAQTAAQNKARGNAPPGTGALGWGPTVDGKILPAHSFDPTAPAISANVPLLVGTVLNEFTTSIGHPENERLSMDEVSKRVHERYSDKSDRIIAAYRRAHPNAKPFDLMSLIFSAQTRQNAVTQAGRKTALGAAPAYLYWFTWQTPVLDGRPRAFHCAELSFCFYNTDRCAAMTGGTTEARELSAKVADAWINFARKGDPNHSGLPKWPAFTAEKGATMIFDKTCEAKNDPDREERSTISA